MEELKPCPFCARTIGHSDDCWISMLLNYYDFGVKYSFDEFIKAWNTRAESEQDKCNRERLVQIGEAVVKKEPIHFLTGETYVLERTCKGCVYEDSPDPYPCCCCSRDELEDKYESMAVS